MGWNLKSILVYLKSAPSNLSNCNISGKKQKCLNLEKKKNALFGYFRAGILKQYWYIWNQHPRICLIAIFWEKMKMSKFGTKNALFGYFCVTILKNYWHIWRQHPQICQTAKFREKMKMPKFVTENAFFGCFWVRILKSYCHIWISTLKFVCLFERSGVRFSWRSGFGSEFAL